MSRLPNTNPFDPKQWVTNIEVSLLAPIAYTSGASKLVLPPDPWRLWFILAVEPISGGILAWPGRQTGTYGIRAVDGQSHVLIHNASYPSLVQAEWWAALLTAPATVHIITGRAVTEGER